MADRIKTCLWFDTEAKEAAEFYCSVFPNSKVKNVWNYTEAGPRPAGSVMEVEFELDGRSFLALNGGPEFKFDEAISLVWECESQAEIDRVWTTLTSDGGEESICGWLKDKYGLSWQIVPANIGELLHEPESAARVHQAVFGMKKIDIATLEKARDGDLQESKR
jgi:predicted 3-demethylubiquinone-9 3-methyltransferase (glyoxalase superfamily)